MYINTICLSKYFYDLNFISVLHLNLNFVLILFLYDKRSINRLIAVVEHNTSIAQWQQTETTFNKELYGSEARMRGCAGRRFGTVCVESFFNDSKCLINFLL